MTDDNAGPAIDWAAIRARYEKGEEKLKAIAADARVHYSALTLLARREGWLLANRVRKAIKPTTTQATLKRLKDILHNRLVRLEAEIAAIGGDIEKLDSEKGYRNLNTLVRTLDKVLELERNERKSRRKPDDFKHVDDAERAALAGKIERLQQEWRGREAGGTASAGGGEGA